MLTIINNVSQESDKSDSLVRNGNGGSQSPVPAGQASNHARPQRSDKYGQLALHRHIDQETGNSACFDMCRRILKHKIQLATRLTVLIPTLEVQQAIIMRLLYYSGVSLEETARRMSMSEAQVINLRDAAIRCLKSKLEGRRPGVGPPAKKHKK